MEANRYGEELEQLESTIKEEGLFCVEWCLQGRSQDFVRGFPSSYAQNAREKISDHAHF
jgi:hypothetical protein